MPHLAGSPLASWLAGGGFASIRKMIQECLDNIAGMRQRTLARLRPVEKISPWMWAEGNVELSSRTTSKPGRYDSSWMPYVRAWHDDFVDPGTNEIVICAGAQMSKTESLLNMVRYGIAVDPGPLLWVMPSADIARSFSETRLQPSLEDCDPCAVQIPSNSDKFKLMEMHLNNMNLNLAGANSAGQLASRPIRYLFLDEIDKFPESTSKEAGAVDLAKVRTTTFWNRKIVCTSTPTLEDAAVWQSYLKGDQRKFHLRCPMCGEQFLLELSGLEFEEFRDGDGWDLEGVEQGAGYKTPCCETVLPQSSKGSLLNGGEWLPTNENHQEGVKSYHISTLYSPFVTWGEVAVKFLQSKGDYSAFQNFTNSVLALPWKQNAEEVEESEIDKLVEDYNLCGSRADMPEECQLVSMSSDVGREYLVYTVHGWGKSGDSWLLDYGKVNDFEELQAVSDSWAPDMGMMDAGYRPSEVYQFCANSRGIWKPSRGSPTPVAGLVKSSNVPWGPGKTYKERRIDLVLFYPDAFKSQLYLKVMRGEADPWRIPKDVGGDYRRQVTAERIVQKRDTRGRTVAVWVQDRHKPNHYGDCEVLQIVMLHLLRKKLRRDQSGEGKNDKVVDDRSRVRRKRKRVGLRSIR